jgi:hypothetical protein
MANATPNTPDTVSSTADTGVLAATTNLLITSYESTPLELMTDLIFEDIGGQEIINISRTDIINGQDIIYQPIKNLTSINYQYNPQNILSLQDTSENYFKKFPINAASKVPSFGSGPNGSTVYIDENTGNLIIELVNIEDDEQVEIQILRNGKFFDDTIYEVQ